MIVFLTLHYVSLASMLGAIAFPIGYFATTLFVTGDNLVPSMIVFSISAAILVLFTHQKNIERLLKKEEPRMYFFKKKEEKIVA